MRALRFHGSRDKQTFEYVGYNSRLDEIQAAILRVLLPQIDAWCDGRRAGAQAYIDAGLGDHLELGGAPLGATPAWHLYVATHPDADAKLKLLERRRRAGSRATTACRCTASPRWRRTSSATAAALELPVTEELARTNLALPISPVFTRAQADEVVAALAAA